MSDLKRKKDWIERHPFLTFLIVFAMLCILF